MSAPRFSRLQRASALLPLAILSAIWTAGIGGMGGSVVSVVAGPAPSALPGGASVPTQAIEAPASVSSSDVLAPGLAGESSSEILAAASTSAIPSAALAAYQRAETVINAADASCHLPWQLVAAIGRVESDHGRFAGSSLDGTGLATPGIYGVALDGTNQTSLIADTDAGQYDRDSVFDRAVGPMQFIPSTWSIVGVDADGDGQRDPQDIDDASLATAVYLCSGSDDLATTAGQQASVFRYNHSTAYVDLVLSIMQAYLAGDFTLVPGSTTMAGAFPGVITPSQQPRLDDPASTPTTDATLAPPDQPDPTIGPTSTPTPKPKPTPKPTPTPTANPTGAPGPTPPPTGGTGSDGPPELPGPPGLPPIDEVLTLAEAREQCAADGISATRFPDDFQGCVDGYMNP